MKNIAIFFTLALATGLMPATALGEDADDKSQIVCKNEPRLGSRIPLRICKTRAQLEEEKRNAEEATDAFQHDSDFQLHGGG